jgi:hypothetical protein
MMKVFWLRNCDSYDGKEVYVEDGRIVEVFLYDDYDVKSVFEGDFF